MSLFHILQFFPKEKSTLGLTNKFCSFFCRGTNNYYICIRFVTGCSAVRLARQLRELEVPGSNPGTPTNKKENIFDECSLFCLSACTDSTSIFFLQLNRTKRVIQYSPFAHINTPRKLVLTYNGRRLCNAWAMVNSSA